MVARRSQAHGADNNKPSPALPLINPNNKQNTNTKQKTDFRVKQVAIMALDLQRWVARAHPYWNRTGGADHIWLFAHDEGACWAPRELYERSVVLTHWGRADGVGHVSGSTYGQDNYSM